MLVAVAGCEQRHPAVGFENLGPGGALVVVVARTGAVRRASRCHRANRGGAGVTETPTEPVKLAALVSRYLHDGLEAPAGERPGPPCFMHRPVGRGDNAVTPLALGLDEAFAGFVHGQA